MKIYRKIEHIKFCRAMLVLSLGVIIVALLLGCSGGSSESFTISGQVTSGGSALSGVQITLSGDGSGVVTTDVTGSYSFSVSNYSSYTLTPSLAGYTFRPSYITAYIQGANGGGFNFTGITQSSVAASLHTVYLSNDGTVWTWGSNSNGQLGIGSTGNGTISADEHTPQHVPTLSGIIAIAAGYAHTVALKNDGTVWTWGCNSNGQLGNGNTGSGSGCVTSSSINDADSPQQVTTLSGIIAIAAGYAHTVAVRNDGTVWTWGCNSNGQLGNGNTGSGSGCVTTSSSADEDLPVQVIQSTGMPSTMVSVAAGWYHTLALTSTGGAWAWGSNAYGQLGNGNTGNGGISFDEDTPVQVSSISNLMAIAAGYDFSLALQKNSQVYSTVWAWGYNGYGQLGDNTTTNRTVAVSVHRLIESGAIGIAAGYLHAVAMKTDGTVYAWGYNGNGQLGNGSTTDSWVPLQVSGISSVTNIAAGYNDSVALELDNTVWAWGYNGYGQLGNGSTTDSPVPVQ